MDVATRRFQINANHLQLATRYDLFLDLGSHLQCSDLSYEECGSYATCCVHEGDCFSCLNVPSPSTFAPGDIGPVTSEDATPASEV